jgi:hypothetical protein
LRRGDRIRPVVGFEASDASIFHVGDEETTSAAVVSGTSDANLFEGHDPSVEDKSREG